MHPHQLAPSSDLDAEEHPAGNRHVIEHTSVSSLHLQDGEAGLADAFTHDPPDQRQSRAPSRQVCLPSRAVLLSACVYTYVSCDRIPCYRFWIVPIAPRHHAPHRGARRRPPYSFLPRLRVPHPLTPSPTPFLQKNPLYPLIHHRHRHRHHRHLRCVDLVAVTHR